MSDRRKDWSEGQAGLRELGLAAALKSGESDLVRLRFPFYSILADPCAASGLTYSVFHTSIADSLAQSFQDLVFTFSLLL